MWATNLYKDVGCFGNETNSRLECHNAVIKQVVSHYSKVPDMIHKLLFDLHATEQNEAN